MMVVLNGLFGGLVDCLAYDGLSEVAAPARTAGQATTGRARQAASRARQAASGREA